MTQTKLQPYLQALMKMRESLLLRIEQQREGKASRAEVAFAHFDHTQDDEAQINSERDIEFAINENETAQLQSIDEALKRITQGVYGLCLECGTRLPRERLLAAPQATRCMACQTTFETAHATH
jgi:DnaK suppressor protein